MKYWLFIIVAVLGEVVATTTFKATDGFTKPLQSILVLIGYGISFYFLSLALKSIPVGIVYAIWAGLGVVIVTFLAWLIYGQKIDNWGFLGM
ncbi:DMT family transporter [Gallaecimonas mangrovi]|uniref:DMT family transporter n=1 Tax=Gallaecimonas mangrovi TaxID=2291597 RepID=UPI000E207DC8|nr:multidrug efflux SMR transporter [Gallaecimonas mangrovi]